MTRLDWEKAKQRQQKKLAYVTKKERKQKARASKPQPVHPNSMAARKWGLKQWRPGAPPSGEGRPEPG